MTNPSGPQPPPLPKGPDEVFCSTCGKRININAEICPGCGVRQRKGADKTTLAVLTFFLGGIGGHKFYLGKYGQGILYLLFCWTGIPAIIALVEVFVIAGQVGKFNQQKATEIAAIIGGAGLPDNALSRSHECCGALDCTLTCQGGTAAPLTRPTITSSRGSHSL